MLYLAENLKHLRKEKDLTQEDVAAMLHVSPQSVSKWERGETTPDITLLPALANLYKVSVDALIGMDKINDEQMKDNVFTSGYKHLRADATAAAIDVFSEALKLYPDDEDYLSYLAMALALDGDEAKLRQAITLCERILAEGRGLKTCHTTRAALCFIYQKAGEKEKALKTAHELPHRRESREVVIAELEKGPDIREIDTYLKFIAIGEHDEQDVIEISFGIDMLAVCTEYDLLGRIKALREEHDMRSCAEAVRKIPLIRVRDKGELAPRRVRVRHYADYPLDKDFIDPAEAADEVMAVLQKITCISPAI